MTALAAFHLAVYLLAADGLIALAFTGLVGLPLAGLVGVAMAGSLGRQALAARLPGRSLGRLLGAGAAILSVLDIVYLAESLLQGFIHLLLFLLVYRLYTQRSIRDGRDLAFLSFIMLVAAASAALDVAFLVIVVAFVILAVLMLMLLVVLGESERTRPPGANPREPARLEPAMLTLGLAASLGTLVLTVAFFVIIPRAGQAALPFGTRLGTTLSGFTDRVELGAFGTIESDATVVMRVRFPAGPAAPERLADLRWRGLAFDHFDGRGWQVHREDRRRLPREGTGQFEVASYTGAGPIVTQEIYLEPIGTDVIFAAPRVLTLGIQSETVTVDDMGAVAVAMPTARLRYVVRSELESHSRRGPGGRRQRPSAAPAGRYLQLPPIPARIGELARSVTAGAAGNLEAAVRLRDFLSRQYRYTLTLSRQTALDPLEEFLFVRRSGNCEYFAASLAVMLRSVGIPARVVNGFQRGEWNPYGAYFVVRQRDAHAWVEAHIADRGWITLDPSPRGEAAGSGRSWPIGLYIDALRLRWYRYVINWSFDDQVALAAGMQRAAFLVQRRSQEIGRWPALAWPGPATTVVVALGGMAALVWWMAPGRGPAPTAYTPRFYGRALRIVGRRGLRPEAAETAREFLDRVGAMLPPAGEPLARITAAYERVRFGATPPSADDTRALAQDLAQLRSCR